MSTDRDVNRIVRSWLEEGVTTLPDRVLDDVLDRIPATPQRRSWWPARRFAQMNNTAVRWGIAAAAVILAATVGFRLLPEANVGGDPSPTPSPSSMAFNDVPDGDVLSPGSYFIDGLPVGITLTVPTGWEVASPGGPAGAGLRKLEGDSSTEVLLVIWPSVHWVYDDPCNAATVREVGPSVDELVDALTKMSSVDASTPTEASVDGFTGQHLTLQRALECPGDYRLWLNDSGSSGRVEFGQGDPATDEVWVLDVDGTRLVIGIHSFTSAAAADLAEAREVVDSISIDSAN